MSVSGAPPTGHTTERTHNWARSFPGQVSPAPAAGSRKAKGPPERPLPGRRAGSRTRFHARYLPRGSVQIAYSHHQGPPKAPVEPRDERPSYRRPPVRSARAGSGPKPFLLTVRATASAQRPGQNRCSINHRLSFWFVCYCLVAKPVRLIRLRPSGAPVFLLFQIKAGNGC